MEQLLARAEHLGPGERSIVRAVYGQGMSVTDLARASGVSRSTMSRRLHRALRRLQADESLFVLRHGRRWDPERRRVARKVIVQGASQREAARALGVSVHRVRQHLAAVKLLHAEGSAAS